MQTSKFGLRALYLFSFGTALWSGFYTYRFFVDFRSAAQLNSQVVLLNAAVLLLLWFFTLTSRSNFVRENIYFIIIAPLLSIYGADIYFAFNAGAIDSFLPFVAVSSLLFISPERFQTYERRLKDF